MKERPILFSAPMVKAILDGTKTQTRRVVSNKFLGCIDPDDDEAKDMLGKLGPYGASGDQLWVRENFSTCYNGPESYQIIYSGGDRRNFSAAMNTTDDQLDWLEKSMTVHGESGRPSIHMPRWASRIQLEVVEVRVQRLQKISEWDAKDEGVTPSEGVNQINYKGLFYKLWNSINGKREGCSWESNPWVWAITFKRLKP